ncbi:hypothetical protein MtrunA17_Chr4g0052971 [Medicago truncatula]|uniref:Uncharacterized protein n=1 Tax=Medicago truncatula TaxID=3880 RepID=I3SX77_MEDTR|nr:unknown [Medicago truncatula]RHN62945.1 hypothetical protein MtrunA17_Chr4g0052971 [Medicago truncatula]
MSSIVLYCKISLCTKGPQAWPVKTLPSTNKIPNQGSANFLSQFTF